MPEAAFTPAAGRFLPTSAYDRLLALLTREATWRAKLLEALAPKPGERILDVGSGTGTFAILIKQKEPHAIVVGLDPDPEARRIAAAKAAEAEVEVAWQSGFARDAANFGKFPIEEKRAGLEAMFNATKPAGRVLVADYAEQRSWLMRQAFKIVQSADGRTNTQPNSNGFLERELTRLCGAPLTAAWALDTPTGTISLFSVTKTSR